MVEVDVEPPEVRVPPVVVEVTLVLPVVVICVPPLHDDDTAWVVSKNK